MKFPLSELIAAFASGFTMWFWQNYKTKRERKKIDFENLNGSFEAMIQSQKRLMEQNESLINQLLIKEEQNADLRKEVDELKQKVRNLEHKLNKYIKDNA